MEELTKALVEAKQSAEAERDRALEQSRSSVIEKNEAVRQLQEQEADIQQRISRAVLTATKKKDNTIRLLQEALEASRKILNIIAEILYQTSEVFRRALMRLFISVQNSTSQSLPHPKQLTSRA